MILPAANLRNFVMLFLALGGSFTATVLVRSQPPAEPPATTATTPHPEGFGQSLARRLGLSDEQARQVEALNPAFDADLQRLRADQAAARAALAAAFEAGDAPNETIRALAEAVIETHTRVERTVIDQLLAVRHLLSADQQKRLFELCAEGVREGSGRRWRGGRGESPDAAHEHEQRGHGPGQGRGRRMRGGRG